MANGMSRGKEVGSEETPRLRMDSEQVCWLADLPGRSRTESLSYSRVVPDSNTT